MVENQVLASCDSGEVFLGEKVIAKGVRESGMSLSYSDGLLTCGFQNSIKVLDNQFREIKKISKTSDNVSFAVTSG